MLLVAVKLKAGLAAAAAVAPLVFWAIPSGGSAHRAIAPEMVELAPGAVAYRAAGDFSRAGRPVDAPLRSMRIDRPLTIMKRQVTAAEYQSCVEAGACPEISDSSAESDRPAVGVSWRDADAYAAWLSRATGEQFRLPTDEEWAYAAGSRWRDDALPESDANDPSRRWLARYQAESERSPVTDRGPQPIGTFGANEHGLVDLAGNVWEWTDSCFMRGTVEPTGELRTTLVNCGVRVVAGGHRTYVSDFVRDARTGGCAVGTPPSNLGFRLVRDDDRWRPLRLLLHRARAARPFG